MKVGRKNFTNSVTLSFMLIHFLTGNLFRGITSRMQDFKVIMRIRNIEQLFSASEGIWTWTRVTKSEQTNEKEKKLLFAIETKLQ